MILVGIVGLCLVAILWVLLYFYFIRRTDRFMENWEREIKEKAEKSTLKSIQALEKVTKGIERLPESIESLEEAAEAIKTSRKTMGKFASERGFIPKPSPGQISTTEPIKEPVDSTANERARRFCQQGRELVARKAAGDAVDLDKALGFFQEAAKLDSEYWEPKINVAQILLLKGLLDQSFAWAAEVRDSFSEVPLAFAKAGLIMAAILERRIDPDAPEERKRSDLRKIAAILEDSLMKCPGHMTTRYSLGRVLFLCGEEKSVIEKFLKDSLKYTDFSITERNIQRLLKGK